MYELEQEAKIGVKKTEFFEKISEAFEYEPFEKTKQIIEKSHKQYLDQQFMKQQKITRIIDIVKLLTT
jgi:hypothetical protein